MDKTISVIRQSDSHNSGYVPGAMSEQIVLVSPDNAAQYASEICAIYNHYIESTTISFEEIPLRQTEIEERIRQISAKYPYLVWLDEASNGGAGGNVVNGYAYINTWKERSAYRYSAETSIYVRDGFQGRGLGGKLMEGLLQEVRKTDIHVLVAGITLPNDQSVALHEKFGFKEIGRFSEVGRKFGKWLDMGYWELVL